MKSIEYKLDNNFEYHMNLEYDLNQAQIYFWSLNQLNRK